MSNGEKDTSAKDADADVSGEQAGKDVSLKIDAESAGRFGEALAKSFGAQGKDSGFDRGVKVFSLLSPFLLGGYIAYVNGVFDQLKREQNFVEICTNFEGDQCFRMTGATKKSVVIEGPDNLLPVQAHYIAIEGMCTATLRPGPNDKGMQAWLVTGSLIKKVKGTKANRTGLQERCEFDAQKLLVVNKRSPYQSPDAENLNYLDWETYSCELENRINSPNKKIYFDPYSVTLWCDGQNVISKAEPYP